MSATKRSRRIVPIFGLVAVLTAGLSALGIDSRGPAPVAAEALGGLASLISTTGGTEPAVSGDGRFVVYQGLPLVADGRAATVWLRDQQTNVSIELTTPTDSVRLGDSVLPNISADGCVVVLTTQFAFDLFRDDDKGNRWDVYRATLPACGGQLGDWELVSTVADFNGQAAALGVADPTQRLAISGSGSVVAYVRPFQPRSGLVDPTNLQSTIEVVDFSVPVDDFGRSSTAAGMPSGAPDIVGTFVGQRSPALSGDGSVLVFVSDATANEAVPQWPEPPAPDQPAIAQVFAWDRNNADPFANVVLISQGSLGASSAAAFAPSVSTDARFVAFTSAATNLATAPDLTTCGGECPTQVYRVDRDTDNNLVYDEVGTVAIALISAAATAPNSDGSAAAPVAGNGNSGSSSLSSDGNTMIFSTQAGNLLTSQVPGFGAPGDGDVLLADLNTGVVRRAFARTEPLAGAHAHPVLSANGRVLVADSMVAGALVGNAEVTDRQVVSTLFIPTVLMAPIDIGTIIVAVPSGEWRVFVNNDGPGSFTPATIQTNNPDFALTGGSCFDKAAVPAGKSCDVRMVLTPSAAGPILGTLTVAEYGYGAVTLTSALFGAGGDPAFEAFPAGVDLGTAQVNAVAERQVITIENVSLTPVAVSSVRLLGLNPTDFKVVNNGCQVELALGQKCAVQFEFTPLASGRRSATAVFDTATGQYTSALLSGEGYYSAALLADPRVSVGSRLGVGGVGFPATTAITIGFSDGSGRSMTVTSDRNGTFLTTVLITKGQRAGRQVVLAQAADGTSASIPVVIERQQRNGPGSPTWPTP